MEKSRAWPPDPLDAGSGAAESLFLQWLERADAADQEFDLEAACAARPDLASDLRRLHVDYRRAQVLLAAAEAPRPPAPEDPSGRYQVRGLIGAGGMGAVFEVWDRGLRRTLALKVATDGAAGARSPASASSRRTRLLREARVLGQIEHPGIVPVHEQGTDVTGRPFFTMRRVRGRDLGQVLRQLRRGQDGWTLPRVVAVLQRVCETVAYAHSRGVIHRDLKPRNVMVGPFGETYVMDWGLAKVLGAAIVAGDDGQAVDEPTGDAARAAGADAPGELTLAGDVVGTPAYMAPEQAAGSADAGAGVDVYGVGAMLYELLSGRAPYAESSGTPSRPHQVLAALRRGPPDAIERLARSAPPELLAICDKAMQRDPAARFASMLELAENLRAFLEGRVVRVHRTGAFVELRKWVGRNRLAAAGAGAALAALAVAGGLQWRSSTVLAATNAELDIKVTELQKANGEAEHRTYAKEVALAAAALAAGDTPEAKHRLANCAEGRRQWEWHWLARRVDTANLVLQAHSLGAALAVSPDGMRLATVGADRTVGVWDAVNGTRVGLAVQLDADANASVVWWPDGSAFGVHRPNVDALQRHAADARFERVLQLGRKDSCDVAFAPNATLVAFAGRSGVTLHDAHTLELLGEIPLAAGPSGRPWPHKLAFLAADAGLAVACGDGLVRVFDPVHRALVRTLAAPGPQRDIAVHPRRPWVASAALGGVIELWDASSGERIGEAGRRDGDAQFAWHPERPWLARVRNRVVEAWDYEAGHVVWTLVGHEGGIECVEFSPDGSSLFAGSAGVVRRWDVGNATVEPAAMLPASTFYLLDVHPDRPFAALATRRDVLVFERGKPEALARRPSPGQPESLVFSSDGRFVVTADRAGNVSVWDWERDEVVFTRKLATWARATLTPDGKRLAAWNVDARLELLSLPAGELLGGFVKDFRDEGCDVAFSPDGHLIACGGKGNIWLLDGATAHEVGRLDLPQPRVERMRFSPSGDRLAVHNRLGPWAWGQDRLVVFDVASGTCVWQVPVTTGANQASWTRDGARLLTAGDDGAIHVWDATNGQRITAVVPDGPLSAGRGGAGQIIALNRDGSLLVTVSTVWHTLRFHDAGPATLRRR